MVNPTWFSATEYLDNKLAQLQAIDPTGKENGNKAWDADSLTKALEAAGYKGDEGAYQHFVDYGMDENISPNASFDTALYLAAKAEQLNQINFEGKTWTAASVMDAITAAGMGSAWEHYQLYGSAEGIATGDGFDSAAYFVTKVAQMNATNENGRSNWTVDEVKAIFAEQGLTALEHYNLYGKDEKLDTYAPEGVDFTKAEIDHDLAKGFDAYTRSQEYSLSDALAAQRDGSLADNYTLTDDAAAIDAGNVTVAEQAALKDFVAGAVNGAEYAKSDIVYSLDDTLANISNVAASVLQGSDGGYYITDSVANIGAATGITLKNAETVTADVTGDTSVAYSAEGMKGFLENAQTSFVAEKDALVSFTGTTGNDAMSLANLDKVTLDKVELALVGGNGADYLSGGSHNDIIFAGNATAKGANGVYAEGTDSFGKDAINADFAKAFFGPEGNWMSESAQTFFKGHNIVEGRAGDDTLVASAGDDLFLFQTGGGTGTPATAELGFAALGKDTIHSFAVGNDALFIMDQSDRTGNIDANGAGLVFSSGWKFGKQSVVDGTATSSVTTAGDSGMTGDVTVVWSDNFHTATVTIDGSLVNQNSDDLVITLVGVQGATDSTTVADLFGLAQATA